MDALDSPPSISLFTRLLRRIYVANPFYVISAALVLYAIHLAGDTHGTWRLLGLLGGYTAAMAATGVLIVRLGRVWDDARSIVLIVVGMLLVVSVGFDELAVDAPELLRPRLYAGLGVAVAMFEAMLAGLGIRLRFAFRLPYHALLAVFYLYPIVVADVVAIVHAGNKDLLAVAVGGWPFVVAAAALGLLPAARMGRTGVAGNGTPWPWPLFPWVAYGGVGVAAGLRAWLLCNAFYTGGELDPFGGYLLIPLVFSAGVIVLEIALTERYALGVVWALAAPLMAFTIAFPGGGANPVRDELLGHLCRLLGAPAEYALALAAVFYAYAWGRGVRWAELGVVGSLVALAHAGPKTLAPLDLLARVPDAGPILAAGAYLALSLVWSRDSWRLLGGGSLLAWGLLLCCPAPALDPEALTLVLTRHGLSIASAGVLALVATRGLFNDHVARLAGWCVAPSLTGMLVAALFDGPRCATAWPSWLLWLYATLLVAGPAVHAGLTRRASSAGLAGLHATVFAARLGVAVYDLHRDPYLHPAVLPAIWSVMFFTLGVGISATKGGAFRVAWTRARARYLLPIDTSPG